MLPRKIFALAMVLVIGFAARQTMATTPIYHLTDLGGVSGGLFNSGGSGSGAAGINASGQVVGVGNTASGPQAFLWTPQTANGFTGTMIDLGTLPGGGISYASGINTMGQIVGGSSSSTGTHSFLWTPASPNGTSGSMTDLGVLPNYTNSSGAAGINDFGQITGSSSTGPSVVTSHAFLWTPTSHNGATGSMIDLGELSGGASYGFGINASGQVVGGSGPSNNTHGFVWTPSVANGTTGTMADLNILSTPTYFSFAESINSFGQIAGEGGENLTGAPAAFLWTPNTPNGSTGSTIYIGSAAGDNNDGHGVNSSGWVVGKTFFGGPMRAFLWTPADGVMNLNNLMDQPIIDENGVGWTLMTANAINDSGQIIGQGLFDPDGPDGPLPQQNRAFLLTPVPEPTAVLWIALVCLTASRRIRAVCVRA